jgi:hypothetical protein
MTQAGTHSPIDLNVLERDLRLIPGVVACAVGTSTVDLLLDPAADGGVVRRRSNLILDAAGGLELHLLVPRAARPKRQRSRVVLVTAAASLAMTAALLPLAFGSLPPSQALVLHAAPPAAAAPTYVSAHAGRSVSVTVDRVPVPPPVAVQALLPQPAPVVRPPAAAPQPSSATVARRSAARIFMSDGEVLAADKFELHHKGHAGHGRGSGKPSGHRGRR